MPATKQSAPDALRPLEPGEAYDLPDDEYEAREKALQELNVRYYNEFGDWLEGQGLSDKTVQKHIDNASVYLDLYLMRDLARVEDGASMLDGFFGDFFIRKCLWSTPGNLRTTAASIKKFYRCMEDLGHVPQGTADAVKSEVKASLNEWCEECRAFNEGEPFDDLDNPFFGMGGDLGFGLSSGFGSGSGPGQLDVAELLQKALGGEVTFERVKPEQAVKELTLMLMYLTSFTEDMKLPEEQRNYRAWKGYDFKVLDELDEEGLIDKRSNASKSVWLLDAGRDQAQELLDIYGIDDWR